MEQTITFNIPEGKTYTQNIDENGNIIISFIDKPKRSKSWEEFCKNHLAKGYIINTDSSIFEYNDNFGECKMAESKDRNLLESKEDAESVLALIQLTRLHDEWVGDWKPNYNVPILKYFIKYKADTCTIDSACITHNFLVFPSAEMAESFIECFSDLITIAKRFI